MAKKNQYEQLVEFIINEDAVKAKAMLHKIVLETSRNIYDSLNEEGLEAGMDSDSFSDDISADHDAIDGDEEGMDDEFGDSENEFGDEGDDLDGEGEGDIEDRVMDLEDAIDELKAEFEELMAGEENEEENIPGIHDKEGSDEFGDEDSDLDSADEIGSEEETEDAGDGIYENQKTSADLMREYVEKVTAVKSSEGDFVGTGSESGAKPTVNKRSPSIGGKNDMGGSTANIARGGSETAPDGQSVKKPSNYLTKGETKMDSKRSSYANTAGGRGDKLDKVSKTATKEGQTTDGSVPVAKKSVIESKRRTK